jgi:ribose/xylose/arabinose/galactoside ABC-type transport system permease subunit
MSGERRVGDLLAKLGPMLGLVLVWSAFAVGIGERFWSWDNGRLMLLQTSIVAIAAIGATLVIVAGMIDLAVGSAVALATVIVALLLEAGFGPWAAIAGGIGSIALTGAVVGAFVTGQVLGCIGLRTRAGRRIEVSPFVVTLAMWGALRGLAKGLGDNQPVYVTDATWLAKLVEASPSRGSLLADVSALDLFAVAAPCVWVMLVLAIAVAFLLRATVFGRHVFAVGSNVETAHLCGIAVAKVKVMTFVIAGACAGLAGAIQFAYLGMGDPTTAAGLELRVIAAVVIGGASLTGGEGSIVGTLLGALLMTVVDNGCTKLGLPNWVQEIATGGIILVAVILDRIRHGER